MEEDLPSVLCVKRGLRLEGYYSFPLASISKHPRRGPLRSAVSARRPAEGLADVLALAGDNICGFGAGARRQ